MMLAIRSSGVVRGGSTVLAVWYLNWLLHKQEEGWNLDWLLHKQEESWNLD